VIIWIAAILLISAVALFIAAPLTEPGSNRASPRSRAEAERREHEHALAVQALRELEFDHAMGKLDVDDYRELWHKLELRALSAMSTDGQTPAHPSPHFAEDGASPLIGGGRVVDLNFCAKCGHRISQPSNFCPNCGSALATLREAKSIC
jgi:cytochrome c-type biogenesis protein CcmI